MQPAGAATARRILPAPLVAGGPACTATSLVERRTAGGL